MKKRVKASSEFLLHLKAQVGQMNPAQEKVARYILDYSDDIPGMPIGLLAMECGVSEATISRFVKFLGCTNYRGFQAEMVKSNILEHGKSREKVRGYADVKNADHTDMICKKIFEANMQCLADSLAVVDVAALEKAADIIVQKKKMCILAQGRSVVTATSIRQRLQRLGISCMSCSDPHEQAIAASLLQKDDIIMGISTYGRSRNLLKNLRLAASNGATVIGVTSYLATPLQKVADILLLASSNETAGFGFEPSCSTVAQMVMLDCLYIMITTKMKDEATETFGITCQALESERE